MGEGDVAALFFDNERGIFVITGADWFDTSDDKPYEVGFVTKDKKLGCVYFDRDSMSVSLAEDADHSDVQGCCAEDEVTLIMKAIQTL